MENRLITLKNPPSVTCFSAVGGRMEREGPLGPYFDYTDPSDRFGKSKWEQSEAESQAIALNLALKKAHLKEEDLDLLLAGDLINQCAGSSYGLLDFDVPYLGIYGACSTSAEGLLLSSLLLDTGHFKRASVVSSSHFCSAERQFRFPLEYGGQRPPTSQWTVTGAGAFILERDAMKGPYITEVLPGIVKNEGINDPSNMGAAMAPAAYDTLKAYFRESHLSPKDFDLILTGDLGREGSEILVELLEYDGIDIKDRYTDCGLLIYDMEKQDVHSGGSGCGCAATVLSADILKGLVDGRYREVLFMATGALMSADAVKQGLSIPGIAHLVHFSNRRF